MKDFFKFVKNRYCSLFCNNYSDVICKASNCRLYDFMEWLDTQQIKDLMNDFKSIKEVTKDFKRPIVKRKVKLKVLDGGRNES